MVMFEVAARTDVGMVRTNNEDSILEHRFIHLGRTYRLLAVADGMGGGPSGEVASRIAIKTLQGRLETNGWTDEKAALTAAFRDANSAVHAVSMERSGGAGSRMGTTLVAALVDEETARAWVANVGDSRCYLLTRDGLEQVTDDHSAIAEMRKMGAPRGNTARFKNVVTRAIGPDAQVSVDIFGPRQLNPGERLLLCSDGLTNMVRDSEIRGVLAHDGVERAAVTLVARANQHGGKDNVSIVVGGLGGGGVALPRRLRVPPVAMAAAGASVAGIAILLAVMVSVTSRGSDRDTRTPFAASQYANASMTPITGAIGGGQPPWSHSNLPTAPPVLQPDQPFRIPAVQGEIWGCVGRPRLCFYVVKSGDNCSTITDRFGLADGALQRANPKCADIYPGNTLLIPLGDSE